MSVENLEISGISQPKSTLAADGSTMTIYPGGTIETANKDGSAVWYSGVHDTPDWRAITSLGPTESNGSHAVAMWLIDKEGNVLPRDGNDKVLDQIVDGQCVAESLAGQKPAPCAEVTPDFALLKSRGADVPNEYLLIPTLNITGVEDQRLLKDTTPNYSAEGLDPSVTGVVKNLAVQNEVKDLTAKGMAQDKAQEQALQDVASQTVSLAWNSAAGRSQDRAHGHVNFILPEVQKNLLAQLAAGKINDQSFQDVGALVNNHDYRAMWVDAADDGTLGKADPFKLVYDSLPVDKKDTMDLQTIVVVPETKPDGRKGFIVLAGTADPATGGGTASGEELQHAWVQP